MLDRIFFSRQSMTVRRPISENIKTAMKLVDVSEAELARMTKLPQATINKILHSLTKDPRLSTIILIAEALNATIAQLAGIEPFLTGANGYQKPQENFIPVIDWNEVLTYLKDVNYPCQFKQWLAVGAKEHKNRYFALKTTPSMAPRFRENSLIIIEPIQSCEDDGRIVLISFNNNEPTLRRLMKDGAEISLRKLYPEPGEKATKLKNTDQIIGVIVEARMPEN